MDIRWKTLAAVLVASLLATGCPTGGTSEPGANTPPPDDPAPNNPPPDNPTPDEPLPVTGCDCGADNSSSPCSGTSVSYKAGPSTISFEFSCDGGACLCGKFANGHDYWVAPQTNNGIVHITGVSPATIGVPGIDDPGGADYRNGWVVNPDSQTNVGLDDRLSYYAKGNHPSPDNPTPDNPYIVDTSDGIKSIWKADHYPDVGVGADCRATATDTTNGMTAGDKRMCFFQTALLTILPTVPENAGTTVLRPPYFGATKPLYSVSSLNFSAFPNLPVPTRPGGDAIPVNWDEALGNLAFPDADWGADFPATEIHHSKYGWYEPLTNGYRAYAPAQRINGALALLVFPASGADLEKKNLLGIRAVQHGLDILAIYKHGDVITVNGQPRGAYMPNGGHAVARYTQALIAAQALYSADPQWVDLLKELRDDTDGAGKFISPETGQFTFNATTGHYTYGVINVSGAGGYRPNLSSGLVPNQSTNSIMADPDGNYDDWPEVGVPPLPEDTTKYLDHGAYQDIVWNSTFFAATMMRAIPALQDFAYNGTIQYVSRMIESGTYVNTSVGVSPVFPLPACASGANAGKVCRNEDDCGGAPCGNGKYSFDNLVWPSANTWQFYDLCLNNKTCAGMNGP